MGKGEESLSRGKCKVQNLWSGSNEEAGVAAAGVWGNELEFEFRGAMCVGRVRKCRALRAILMILALFGVRWEASEWFWTKEWYDFQLLKKKKTVVLKVLLLLGKKIQNHFGAAWRGYLGTPEEDIKPSHLTRELEGSWGGPQLLNKSLDTFGVFYSGSLVDLLLCNVFIHTYR